jgi:hypothetical protein
MLSKDHLALGYYLLDFAGSEELLKHRRAFLAGCVEPDYNMATYLRGMKTSRKFRGHNADNSFDHVSKCIAEFQQQGLCTGWDYFVLGTTLHYVADAFTWPHNTFWEKSLAQHAAYEIQLHPVFAASLCREDGYADGPEPRSLTAFVAESHREYSAGPHEMAADCRYIIGVSGGLLRGSLRYAVPETESGQYWNSSPPYRHGLI